MYHLCVSSQRAYSWSAALQAPCHAASRLAPGLDFFDGCDEYDWPPDTPVLLLIHGLAGSSEDAYCKWMAATATAKGWRAAVLNYRVRFTETLTQNPASRPQQRGRVLQVDGRHRDRQGLARRGAQLPGALGFTLKP